MNEQEKRVARVRLCFCFSLAGGARGWSVFGKRLGLGLGLWQATGNLIDPKSIGRLLCSRNTLFSFPNASKPGWGQCTRGAKGQWSGPTLGVIDRSRPSN